MMETNGKFKLYGIGHRFLQNEDEIRCKISDSLDFFISTHGKITCISSMAAGADIIFMEEAIKKKCEIQIVLPLPLEDYKKDFDDESLKKFQSIIANNTYAINNTDCNHTSREKSYQETGFRLIKESNAILAIWDGDIGKGIGGTKDQIDFAIGLKKEIHWIKAMRLNENPTEKLNLNSELESKFHTEDGLAIVSKETYQRTWLFGIIFGLITVFSVESNFNYAQSPLQHFVISIISVTSLILSYRLLTYKANQLKNKFIKHRFEAETLRARIWEESLKNESIPKSFEHQLELVENSFFENKKRELWIYIQDQINYQKTKRITRFQIHINRVEAILKILRITFFSSFIVLILFYALSYTFTCEAINFCFVEGLIGFLWMSIPPLYAAFEGIMHFNDWKKNRSFSMQLLNRFTQLQGQLQSVTTKNEIDEIQNHLINTFTFEVSEWFKELKNKSLELKI